MNTELSVKQAREVMVSLIQAGICPKCVLEGRGERLLTLSIHTHDPCMGNTYLATCHESNPCGFTAVIQ